MRASQPPGSHTQCATGAYTSRLHRPTKISMAPKRMRSTQAPTSKAAVITAKASWNMA